MTDHQVFVSLILSMIIWIEMVQVSPPTLYESHRSTSLLPTLIASPSSFLPPSLRVTCSFHSSRQIIQILFSFAAFPHSATTSASSPSFCHHLSIVTLILPPPQHRHPWSPCSALHCTLLRNRLCSVELKTPHLLLTVPLRNK
jgi:hypothetical protein